MTPAIGSVTYHAATDVGQKRDHNEDSHGEFVLSDGAVLLVVADGMGGHEGGEIASQIAVEAISQIAQHSPAHDPREKLHNGFLVAHQRVISQAEKTNKQGMGTTAVAAYVVGNEAYVAHIGDSRCYFLREGRIAWTTTDHTRVQKMVGLGILTSAEAKVHPDANIVTRAIGHGAPQDGSPLEPEVQKEPLLLRPGDVMVLCSDGVYDGVSDEEIAQLAVQKPIESATQQIVDLANRRGGHDNITVSILWYGEPAQTASLSETAPAPPAAPQTSIETTQTKEATPQGLSDGGRLLKPLRSVRNLHGVWAVGLVLAVCAASVLWFVLRRGREKTPGRADLAVGVPTVVPPADLRPPPHDMSRQPRDLGHVTQQDSSIATPKTPPPDGGNSATPHPGNARNRPGLKSAPAPTAKPDRKEAP